MDFGLPASSLRSFTKASCSYHYTSTSAHFARLESVAQNPKNNLRKDISAATCICVVVLTRKTYNISTLRFFSLRAPNSGRPKSKKRSSEGYFGCDLYLCSCSHSKNAHRIKTLRLPLKQHCPKIQKSSLRKDISVTTFIPKLDTMKLNSLSWGSISRSQFINLSIPWREWSEAEFSATGISFSIYQFLNLSIHQFLILTKLIHQMKLNIFVVDIYNDPSFVVF